MDRKRRNRIKNIVGLVLFPIVLFMLLRWFENSVAFQPTKGLAITPEKIGRSIEAVFLESGSDKIEAWLFPANPAGAHTNKVFLVCHGNAGNISHRVPLADILLETGAAVLLFDYRGYGRSSGKPTEAGLHQDTHTAYDHLVKKGYAPENIIPFGESLGGAMAIELAATKRVGAVAVMSTFSSIPALGRELFPWIPSFVGSLRFDSLEKIPRIRVPILIMHGREDSIIGFTHGEKLFAASNEPKAFVELAGDHNDSYYSSATEIRRAASDLLNQAQNPSPAN